MPYWFWDPKRNPNVENHPDGVDLGIWAWGRAHGDYHLELGLGRGGGVQGLEFTVWVSASPRQFRLPPLARRRVVVLLTSEGCHDAK